jgi:hypothetical protein
MKAVVATSVFLTVLGSMGCQRQDVQCAGSTFPFRNGWCSLWYSRRGYEVVDILITPRSEEPKYLNAGRRLLHLPEGDVPFGTRGMAYIFDGTNWSKRAVVPFHEKNLPYVSSLQSCNTINEIAERVLLHPEQP